MNFRPICSLALVGSLAIAAAQDALQTRAESSNYAATATYSEVIAFCQALDKESDKVALIEFGKSHEGRSLPLLILSKDGLAGEDAHEKAKLPVIFCMGNIHAGEVEGKEALLMLARAIARNDEDQILEHYVLLVAPIYNADGNERFSKDNRPHQHGPESVGIRENGQGFDLNRDYVKLEAPETRALTRLLNRWDPRLVIDTHTTNGSLHRYTLTYDGPRNPVGDAAMQEYARLEFLPKAGAALKKRSGYETFFYGNFGQNHTRWEAYASSPRFGGDYLGLRNRLSILSEAYVYAPFQDRVLATRDFVRECLRQAVADREKIGQLLREADERASKGLGKIALQTKLAPYPGKVTVKGFVEELVDGKPTAKEPKDYEVEHWAKSEMVREVALPHAYLLPAAKESVIQVLQRHGIVVEELREDIELDVEPMRVASVARAAAAFQGHHLVTLATTSEPAKRRVPAGTMVVRAGQKLGRLAAYLLEPESEDGLAAWNFFDESLRPTSEYPVLRLVAPTTLLTTPAKPLPEDREPGRRVTFEVMHGDKKVNFSGSPSRVEWVEEGGRFLQTREGRLHLVEPETGRAEPLWAEDKLRQSLACLPSMDAKTAEALAQNGSLDLNAQRTAALVEHGHDLYHLPLDGSPAKRLTNTPAAEELATFSPDGQWVAFVRQDNLGVVDVRTATERMLTTDGGGAIRNGKADWIYFEELYHRSWKAFWWSPDSRRLAFHRFDASALPMFHANNTIPLHGELESMRHPKVGDPNPEVRLGIAEVAGGPATWADLSAYTAGAFLISHVGWYPDAGALYFYVQDRAQKWLDFRKQLINGAQERLFRETTPAWVESPGESYFVGADVLFLSERSGWKHLYRWDAAKKEWRALTCGEWEIRQVERFDEKNGWLYFSAAKESPIASDLYRCRLDGAGLERLTPGDGNHVVSIDPAGRFFADAWSKISRPAQIRLHRADGGLVRTVDSNPVHALADFQFGEATLFQINARDGFVLEADLIKPPDFDPQKRYPVWFTTYAGPAAPVIQNGWGNERMRSWLLANLGLVVFRLDPRSASGKGARSAWTAYKQMGVQEMADIEDGIGWLTQQPFVDATRIGMSGHSYGGFMTAYAMTHSKLFAAGISGAPVTDWRLYDSIYTERYMDTLENNPEGYEKTSVIAAAKDLHGKLLLLHGMMDDNVHLQNATRFAQALQAANKDFRLMFYPEMKHGLHGAHYQRLMLDFIQETMGLGQESKR